MRAFLLAATLATVVLPATPAQALDLKGRVASGGAGVTVHRGSGIDNRRRDFPFVNGFDRGRRGRGEVDMVTYGGEWALYNNRSWESDSYNDWWHDQPERSFPRWMSNNQNCDRMWWSGSGWRC